MDGKVKVLIAIWGLMITADCAFSQPDSLWSRRYNMVIRGSIQTHDGDYAFTGYSVRDDVVFSIVTKLDTLGEVIWENTWEDRFSYREILETPDSGIAICGYHRNNFTIHKFSVDGEELYSWDFELEIRPIVNGLLSDSDGGYIVGGWARFGGETGDDFILFKISSEGEIEWQHYYEDSPHNQVLYDILEVPDGGYLLVGNTSMNVYANEVNVIRTDEEGDIVWQEHYGTEYLDISANETGHAIVSSEDGNFVIACQTIPHEDQNGRNFNALMIKIDPDSEIIWMNNIDLGRDEKPRSIEKTLDGGFVFAGYSGEHGANSGNPFIMKTDDYGNHVWSYVEYGISAISGRQHYNAFAHQDRTYSLVEENGENLPGFLQKFGRDPHGLADGSNGFLPYQTELQGTYPNPFNSITTFVFTVGSPATVGIDIFNALGRRQAGLVRRSYPAGQHNISWDAGGLPSGDYFARMTAGGVVSTKKVSLIK